MTTSVPYDMQTETALISAILTYPEEVVAALEMIDLRAISGGFKRSALKAISEMVKEGYRVDIISLSAWIKDKKLAEEYDTDIELSEILSAHGSASSIPDYCKILMDRHIRREVVENIERLVDRAADTELPLSETLITFEKLQSEISIKCDMAGINRLKKGKIVTGNDIRSEVLDYHDNPHKNRGIDCGNGMWSTFKNHYNAAMGTLNIITGIPSHGKSSFMDAIAINTALSDNWKWAIFTPENYPWEMYAQKVLEYYNGSRFHSQSKDQIEYGMDFFNDHFYLISLNEENNTLDCVLNLSLEVKSKNGLNGIVIDPWNEIAIDMNDTENETQWIGRQLSRQRFFARNHNIAYYIVAHPTKISKDKVTGKPGIPTLYDVSGSANWYNKADNGITVYRNFDTNTVDVYVQKIKYKPHGKVGVVTFTYEFDTGRFIEGDRNF